MHKFVFLFLVMSINAGYTPVIADGFHIADSTIHLTEPEQKAVISWDGKTETMLLSSAVASDDIENVVWIVPILSSTVPVVKPGDIKIFESLTKLFEKPKPQGSRAMLAGGAEVVYSVAIGIYDITILKATSAADLFKWLKKSGYKVPDENWHVSGAGYSIDGDKATEEQIEFLKKQNFNFPHKAADIVEEYISRGKCYFVINKIDLKNRHLKAIETLNLEYNKMESEYIKLCEEVNKRLAVLGIEKRIGEYPPNPETPNEGLTRYWQDSEIRAALAYHINGKNNPLGLPVIQTRDLGNGLQVQARFLVRPEFNFQDKNKFFQLMNLDNKDYTPEITMLVLKDGKPIAMLHEDIDNEGDWRTWVQPERMLQSITRGYFNSFRKIAREALLTKDEADKVMGYYRELKKKKTSEYDGKLVEETLKKLEEYRAVVLASLGDTAGQCEDMNRTLYNGRRNSRKSSISGKLQAMGFYTGKIFNGWARSEDVLEGAKSKTDLKKYGDLVEDLQKMSTGIGTPLMFTFSPEKPYYPLKISSLNYGKTLVEVYYIDDKGVADENAVLESREYKLIDDKIREELKDFKGIKSAKVVTRLSFEGETNLLKNDAVFIKIPIPELGL